MPKFGGIGVPIANNTKYNIVDLFSGCGGLSKGFEHFYFFNVIAANDIWEQANETYKHNFPRTKLIEGDITLQETKDKLYSVIGDRKVHIVIGGPPCQSYSMAGKRDPNDKRGYLYEEFIEIVDKLRPIYFVFENVTGLVSMEFENGDSVLETIIAGFENIGYKCKYEILNSADYGVAQKRKRVIIIGSEKLPIYHPKPEFEEYITSEMELARFEDMKENKKMSHIFTRHSDGFIEKIKNTKQGESVTGYSDAFWRLIPNQPSRTVKENHGSVFIHYKFDRCCTPRELAALQSFPDDFQFLGTKSSILKQIGNAVPPLMARAIARQLAKNLYDYYIGD